MLLRTLALGLSLSLVGSGVAMAHADHKHEQQPEIDEAKAKARAGEEVVRLVGEQKVDAAWKEASVKSATKRTADNRVEWVVTFASAKAADKTLYVFLKASGEFVAANFTGK